MPIDRMTRVGPVPTAADTSVTGAHGSRSDSRSPGAARTLARIGIGCVIAAVVLVALLHVLPVTADISPVRHTVSQYALTEVGWAFNLAAVLLALGSLAILSALVAVRCTRFASPGTLLGALWVLALLTVVAFPKHDWSVGPSTSGHIHRAASVVAFLCLPLAVMLLTRRRTPARSQAPGAARAGFWLALASLAWFLPLLGALLVSPVTGVPWYRAVPLGLIERGLLTAEVAAVVALGVCALLIAQRVTERGPAPARAVA